MNILVYNSYHYSYISPLSFLSPLSLFVDFLCISVHWWGSIVVICDKPPVLTICFTEIFHVF